MKEILARANVGRSTFYVHFRGKDELLESAIREMLRTGEVSSPMESAGPADRILRLSLLLFEHIERQRQASDSSLDTQGKAVVHEHLERVLAELVADYLECVSRRQGSVHDVPADLLARYVASTFMLVLNWWVESKDPFTSRKVNDMFRALVFRSVTESLA
ncbi:MAG TPA: TetR/AcrR family transcriptional regulator [Gemmatimonadaceae bacterium]|nr:TetR/AcrR family transcriptional regulator [Gemmatimonadaceae bacterium]